MRAVSARVRINLAAMIVLSAIVAVAGVVRWASPAAFGDTYRIVVAVPDGGGIQRGMPVTVLGTQVGLVVATDVTREDVDLVLEFDGDQPVPRHALVQVLRRSPIGEQAVELTPVAPDWRPPDRLVPSRVPVDHHWRAAEPGTRIAPAAVVVPSSVPAVLERADELLAAIPGPELATVVDELGTALDGRVDVLRELNRDAAELTGTLAGAIPDAQRLIDASEAVLDTLSAHRVQLSGAIGDTADLVETLAATRPDIERTLDDMTPTVTTLDRLVRDQRANLVCLGHDLLALGDVMARPEDLTYLERILDLNRHFYGGFDAATQWDPYRPGVIWARVNILLDQSATAQPKVPLTPTPATRPGAACTSVFGPGVQAVRQTDPPPLPPDPTAPGIDYAPLVAGTDDGGHDGVAEPARRERPTVPSVPARTVDTPATGGGTGLVALWLVGAGWALAHRRR